MVRIRPEASGNTFKSSKQFGGFFLGLIFKKN
ncbi:hypothetical protein SAMN05444395_101439 [Flavobacterium fryxellicola]|nr:hypothetical protein SAMN05444395_101439 [Flavobacterium fryxellicola]